MAGKQTNLRLDPELKQFYIDLGKKNERDYHFYIRKALEKYRDEYGQESTTKRVVENISKAASAIDADMVDWCFDQFWESGIRKVNKKASKPKFAAMLKKYSKPDGPTCYDLTNNVISDIKARLESGQLGFSEMHPTTYLNGERWNDEIYRKPQDDRQAQLEQMDRDRGFGQVIEGEVQNDLLLGPSHD